MISKLRINVTDVTDLEEGLWYPFKKWNREWGAQPLIQGRHGDGGIPIPGT